MTSWRDEYMKTARYTRDGRLMPHLYWTPLTRIVRYEAILMLTKGHYPERYCPQTNSQEITGVPIARRGKARMGIGRGFSNARHGHKVYLFIGKQHWMDTTLSERMSALRAMQLCPERAKVLVGGLGLGLVPLYLARSQKPRKITVCEIEPDVIRLVWPRLLDWCRRVKRYDPALEVMSSDVKKQMAETEERYDYIYLDIWPSVNHKHVDEVDECRELAQACLAPGGRITVWQEAKIRGARLGSWS